MLYELWWKTARANTPIFGFRHVDVGFTLADHPEVEFLVYLPENPVKWVWISGSEFELRSDLCIHCGGNVGID